MIISGVSSGPMSSLSARGEVVSGELGVADRHWNSTGP